MYIEVSLSSHYKTLYTYECDDGSCNVGDVVVVPVKNRSHQYATVVNINVVPTFDINKIKKIEVVLDEKTDVFNVSSSAFFTELDFQTICTDFCKQIPLFKDVLYKNFNINLKGR